MALKLPTHKAFHDYPNRCIVYLTWRHYDFEPGEQSAALPDKSMAGAATPAAEQAQRACVRALKHQLPGRQVVRVFQAAIARSPAKIHGRKIRSV